MNFETSNCGVSNIQSVSLFRVVLPSSVRFTTEDSDLPCSTSEVSKDRRVDSTEVIDSRPTPTNYPCYMDTDPKNLKKQPTQGTKSDNIRVLRERQRGGEGEGTIGQMYHNDVPKKFTRKVVGSVWRTNFRVPRVLTFSSSNVLKSSNQSYPCCRKDCIKFLIQCPSRI